jgi:hypothetical protein
MARPYALAATGQTIIGLLSSACPRVEFPTAQFELYQSQNFKSPMEEGISLYLHRITPANNVRNLPPRVAPDGRRYRQAVSVDLHYLLTAWGKDSVKQQRLLGWAIRTLEDTAIMPAGVLNQHGPETDIFRPTESVDLIMEDISIQDLLNIWEVAKHHIQPSVGYAARMIGLESELETEEFAMVQTRRFQGGQLVETP